MFAWKKHSLLFLMVALLSFTLVASPALAVERALSTEERSAPGMMFDLVALRPLGLAATAVGLAAFIVSLPFSALGGNVGEAAQNLVVEPAKFTFSRPLGETEFREVGRQKY